MDLYMKQRKILDQLPSCTCVKSITLDNSDVKLKINPKHPNKEAIDSRLRVAIVDRDNVNVSAEMAAYIMGRLSAALRRTAERDESVPTFEKWTHTDEILRITCTNDYALEWLELEMMNIKYDKDRKFEVIEEDQLQKLIKICLFIPNANMEEITRIRKLLTSQNKNVKVYSWYISHKEPKDGGLLIVASICEEDVAAIKAQGGSIFYEFSKLKVTIHSPKYACRSTTTFEEGIQVNKSRKEQMKRTLAKMKTFG